MNLNIKKIWNFNSGEQTLGLIISEPINKIQHKILAYTKSGRIFIISADGNIFRNEIVTENTAIWKGLFNNLYDDEQEELILGGLDGLLRTFKYNEKFELIPFWAHQFGASLSGFFIEDINKDNIREIIAYSLDKSIRVLNPFNGNLIWGQIFEQGVTDAIFCEIKGKIEKSELIASSNDGTIRAFDPVKGNLLWFKRFENKVRTLSFFMTGQNYYLVCGGDDKKIHFLNFKTNEEVKTFKVENYIWKSLKYPKNPPHNLIISSYSFDYLEKDINVKDIEFTSKLIVFDINLNIKWTLEKINAELIDYINVFDKIVILTGTTKGELFLIDEMDGKILARVDHGSCINDIKWISDLSLLITCHDDGNINAYNLSTN